MATARVKTILFLLMALTFQVTAWAQCAPGVPSAGNPGCIPPDQPTSPYYQGGAQSPVAAQPVWADRWGAVVVDEQTGQAGLVADRTTKQEAIDAAMRDCAKFGSPNCKLQLAYHNQCVAIGWGVDRFTTASAPTVKDAEADAMRGCSSITTNCKIAYSACSNPVRVK